MIKKRYMILSAMIVSVLLGSLFYVSITSAGKPIPPPDQVEVINFPLDKEGNLKVTQMNEEQNVINWPISTDTLVWWDVSLSFSGIIWSSIYNASGFASLHLLVLWVLALRSRNSRLLCLRIYLGFDPHILQ